jgi:hypothetical protein
MAYICAADRGDARLALKRLVVLERDVECVGVAAKPGNRAIQIVVVVFDEFIDGHCAFEA